jgi:hypothetical protein
MIKLVNKKSVILKICYKSLGIMCFFDIIKQVKPSIYAGSEENFNFSSKILKKIEKSA